MKHLIFGLTALFALAIFLCGCGRRMEDLQKDLRSDKPKVRAAAARTLATFGDEDQAIRMLIDVLRDEDNRMVIDAVANSLVKRGERAVKPLCEFMESVKGTADKPNYLTEYARSRAAWALGKLRYRKDAVKSLKHMRDDINQMVKDQVEKSLRELGYY